MPDVIFEFDRAGRYFRERPHKNAEILHGYQIRVLAPPDGDFERDKVECQCPVAWVVPPESYQRLRGKLALYGEFAMSGRRKANGYSKLPVVCGCYGRIVDR